MTGSMDVHARIRELASIAQDFALESAELAELDAHLADCPACRDFKLALRRDIAAVAALPQHDAPDRVRRRVLGRVAGRRPSRSVLAPLAGLIVLVVVVTPLALQALFRGSPASSQAPQESGEPSAAASAAPTLPPSESWARAVVGDPAAEPRPGSFAAVTFVAGRGFVAVGHSCPPDDATTGCFALAATSVDGRSWEVAPFEGLPLTPVAGQQAGIRGVAAGGPGVVAVGVSGDRDGRPVATVWVSPDGRSWERGQENPTFAGAWMNAVIRTQDDLLVAVGGALRDAGGVDAAVWTSVDGSTWSRGGLTDGEGSEAGDARPTHDGRPVAGLAAVVERTGGGFVALGANQCSQGGPCAGAAWLSSDGSHWVLRPDPALAEGLPVAGASSAKRIVAVGRNGGGAAVWLTVDGTKWDRVGGLPDTGAIELRAAVIIDDGFVAAAQPAHLWGSTDGADWGVLVPGGPFGDGTIFGLSVGGDVRVAVGTDAAGSPTAWYGEPVEAPEP